MLYNETPGVSLFYEKYKFQRKLKMLKMIYKETKMWNKYKYLAGCKYET